VSAQPSESFPRERWIRRRAERAVARRHVLPFLILSIAVISVVTGAVARLIDRRDFHSLGDGIWWSIVTLGTVGYGDIVPHTAWGRVLGSIVIVCGVTFIAFLTATVTSLFVAVDQKEALAQIRGRDEASDKDTRTVLRGVDERLAAIEAKLDTFTGSGTR
jgi:voltage-gated potassium channel